MTRQTIPIIEIEATAATQARYKLDQPTIKRYAEQMESGAKFPPIVVFAEDGSARYHLADGFHRLEAATRLGLEKIACDVQTGGIREALQYALGSNDAHGLPRTIKDRTNAVTVALKDPKWGDWNNSKIATLCNVSNHFVKKIKDNLIVQGVLNQSDTVKMDRADGSVGERKSTTKRTTTKKKTKKKAKKTSKARKAEQVAANKEEFFAGLSDARIAGSSHDGFKAVKLWKCHDRLTDLAYMHEYIGQMIDQITTENEK